MTRHSSTYRKARREEWKLHNALDATKLSWAEMNDRIRLRQHTHSASKRFGNVRTSYAPFNGDRSKYMPHIGAKQRAKGAARAA